jgi:hypothetical protein
MLLTALVVTACGSSDSSSKSDAPPLDSNLFGRWEGITEHSGHNCPTFMYFYSNGRIENYWLDPAIDEINGGTAGTYSADGKNVTATITQYWAGEETQNWMDWPAGEEINTGTYTVSGNIMTLTTEHAAMTFYKGIDPAMLNDLAGTWTYTDGTKTISFVFNYASGSFTMTETTGAVTTGLEQGEWDIYMSVETGAPSGEYIEFITNKFLDVEDADEDGNTTEMLDSFIYRRFSYTLDTGVSPNTITIVSPAETLIFGKDE